MPTNLGNQGQAFGQPAYVQPAYAQPAAPDYGQQAAPGYAQPSGYVQPGYDAPNAQYAGGQAFGQQNQPLSNQGYGNQGVGNQGFNNTQPGPYGASNTQAPQPGGTAALMTGDQTKRPKYRYAIGGAMTKHDSHGLPEATGGLAALENAQDINVDFEGCDPKLFCKCKYEGKWNIHDKNQVLFEAIERTNPCCLCCCAPNHQTEIELLQGGQQMMKISRGFRYPDCCPVCAPPCGWVAEITDSQGRQIGQLVDKAGCCNMASLCGFKPLWEAQNAQGETLAKVEGPFGCITGLCRDTFTVTGAGGAPLGTIGREDGKRCTPAINVCGCCPAILLEDNFWLRTEGQQDPSLIANLVALRVLEDWGFFRTDALCNLSCMPCDEGEPCQWRLHLTLWLCDLFCFGCRWPCYARFKLPVQCDPTDPSSCECCGLEDMCCGDEGECCGGDCCCCGDGGCDDCCSNPCDDANGDCCGCLNCDGCEGIGWTACLADCLDCNDDH